MANVKSTTMETFNKNNNRLNAIIGIIKARKKSNEEEDDVFISLNMLKVDESHVDTHTYTVAKACLN